MKNKGKFIVFEGIDGAGKSTQIKKLSKHLKVFNYKTHSTFEPTNGPIGSLLRKMLSKKIPIDQRSIAPLFAADRTDHLTNKKNGIRKKIDQGRIVLCDRYYFSSYAYHSQYIDMEWVIHINSLNAEILKPDLTIFIDVEPETCFERIKNNRSDLEMYEKIDIMKKVRKNYFKAFDILSDIEKIAVINGNNTSQIVENEIWNKAKNIFELDGTTK